MGYIVKPLVTEKMNSITEKFPTPCNGENELHY